MKDKMFIIGILIIALIISFICGAFAVSDSKRISFLESELNNYENYEKYNFEELQPSYFFTAKEYPYGNEGIYVMDNQLIIKTNENKLTVKTNKNIDDLTIGRAKGTGSMLPTIPRNAILIEVPIIENELVIGDIIIIKGEDYNIVHRIVNITEEGYITKGDNNNVVDPKVCQIDDLKRKVVGVLW